MSAIISTRSGSTVGRSASIAFTTLTSRRVPTSVSVRDIHTARSSPSLWKTRAGLASRRMRLGRRSVAPLFYCSILNPSLTQAFVSTMPASDKTSPLSNLPLDNSWPRTLSAETPENLAKSRELESLPKDDANQTKRPVYNGHYVLVEPKGLKDPQRVLVSQDVAYNLLQMSKEQVESDEFLQLVSGNLVLQETWATPYALSIMGTRYTNNCPYGTGVGYGDGRAISIAEFNGHELQLKGGGTTPFHRGADGRAVLRSSIREFLASEAMHYLGVATTRALSLVQSSDTVHRPWYSDDAVLNIPEEDDVRLAAYPVEKRKQIIQQLRATQKADPNILIQEHCAITCRVATSFTRIGHFDLFARRVSDDVYTRMDGTHNFPTTSLAWKELEQLIWHACKREFKAEAYDPFVANQDLAGAAAKLLELSGHRVAKMVADWVRVGFAQGNFNADNCLISGRTMDYGPFGWVEEFSPLFAKWTGSGQHFGFLNQPTAGYVNYSVLVESLAPVIAAGREEEISSDKVVEEFVDVGQEIFTTAVDTILRAKMGLPANAEEGDELWSSLRFLLRDSRADWTLFWRQLSYIVRDYPELDSDDYEGMMQVMEGDEESPNSVFYQPLSSEHRLAWLQWMKNWRTAVRATNESKQSGAEVYESMRTINPKYVLREWMLVGAYSAANKGDFTELNALYDLIQRPYEEGSPKEQELYYRRAPDSADARGGTAFMS